MTKIIKFSATWCEPCKAYTPVFREAIRKLPQIDAEEIDVEEFPDKAWKYRIMSVPTTIIIWDDWKDLLRTYWPVSEEILTEEIKKHFKI